MTNAKQIYDTIVTLRKTSGKLDKIALMQKLKGNALAKEYFRMMYEPRVNFYMKKVDSKYKTQVKTPNEFDESTLNYLKKNICTRKVSGDMARIAVSSLCDSFNNPWEKELLQLLIGRDAKAGMGAGTLNKVWADLITDVPYMRCCLPKDAKLDRFPWQHGVLSQLKCDGMFANVTHTKNGEVLIASRSGSPFPTDMFANVVDAVVGKVPAGYQLHGEMLVYKNGELQPRQLGNGQLNSVLQGGELEKGSKIVFVAWDIIPEGEAKAKNKYRVPYKNRFATLLKLLGKPYGDIDSNNGKDSLQAVVTKHVYSMAEASEHYKEMLEQGFEGTIIKDPNMIWEDTTSKHQVKMKLEAECDLKIVGFNPGKGKNEVLFGSIQCESADGKLVVGVSGFEDKVRRQIWEDRDRLIGKIITVRSNCLMKPSKDGGKYSLFLPRYEETRLDKKKADSLDRIIAQFEAAINSVA